MNAVGSCRREIQSLQAARCLLGVSAAASPAEVERRFRHLALRLHPDHGGDPMAFHQLLEARAVLQQTRHGQDPARSPVIVVHRAPWWRRLRWAVLQFIVRRVKPSSPRVQ